MPVITDTHVYNIQTFACKLHSYKVYFMYFIVHKYIVYEMFYSVVQLHFCLKVRSICKVLIKLGFTLLDVVDVCQ